MKLTKINIANGIGLTTFILWIICSAIVVIFPDFSHTVTKWWMHGMDVARYNIGWSSFIWGGITIVASFWFAGYVLGWSLELISKSSSK